LKSWLGAFNVIENGTIQKTGYTVSYSHSIINGSILYRFRDKVKYWARIAIFSYPCIFDPLYKGPRRNITVLFRTEKLECVGSPSDKSDNMLSSFDTIPACDGRRDGRTDERTDIFIAIV